MSDTMEQMLVETDSDWGVTLYLALKQHGIAIPQHLRTDPS